MTLNNSRSDNTEALAVALVRANAAGIGVASAGLPVPEHADQAMEVQALVQRRLDRTVRGWKVALGPEKQPIAAPLQDMHTAYSEITLFPNCTIEVELAVRLGRDLPTRETGSYDRSDILDAIESLVLGIEVIGGRFEDPENVLFLSFLADNLGNRAYIIGDSLPLNTLEQVGDLNCQVSLNEQSIYQAAASHPAGDPLLPLLAYANAQSDHLGGLKAGQVVTTGSLCGVLPVRAAGLLEARISQVGQVSVRFAD